MAGFGKKQKGFGKSNGKGKAKARGGKGAENKEAGSSSSLSSSSSSSSSTGLLEQIKAAVAAHEAAERKQKGKAFRAALEQYEAVVAAYEAAEESERTADGMLSAADLLFNQAACQHEYALLLEEDETEAGKPNGEHEEGEEESDERDACTTALHACISTYFGVLQLQPDHQEGLANAMSALLWQATREEETRAPEQVDDLLLSATKCASSLCEANEGAFADRSTLFTSASVILQRVEFQQQVLTDTQVELMEEPQAYAVLGSLASSVYADEALQMQLQEATEPNSLRLLATQVAMNMLHACSELESTDQDNVQVSSAALRLGVSLSTNLAASAASKRWKHTVALHLGQAHQVAANISLALDDADLAMEHSRLGVEQILAAHKMQNMDLETLQNLIDAHVSYANVVSETQDDDDVHEGIEQLLRAAAVVQTVKSIDKNTPQVDLKNSEVHFELAKLYKRQSGDEATTNCVQALHTAYQGFVACLENDPQHETAYNAACAAAMLGKGPEAVVTHLEQAQALGELTADELRDDEDLVDVLDTEAMEVFLATLD